MDAIDVAVAGKVDSGIIVAIKVSEIGCVADICGRTIVAVGEIGIGIGAQEVMIKTIMSRSNIRFM